MYFISNLNENSNVVEQSLTFRKAPNSSHTRRQLVSTPELMNGKKRDWSHVLKYIP